MFTKKQAGLGFFLCPYYFFSTWDIAISNLKNLKINLNFTNTVLLLCTCWTEKHISYVEKHIMYSWNQTQWLHFLYVWKDFFFPYYFPMANPPYLQGCSFTPISPQNSCHISTSVNHNLALLHSNSCDRLTQTLYSWQSESRGCSLQWRSRYCLSRGFSSLSSLALIIFTAIWISLSAFKKDRNKEMNNTVLTTDFNGDTNCVIYIQVHRNLLSLRGHRWRCLLRLSH